jgi:hypothetical protein
MTSAFWGGFAGSLKEGLDKDEEEKRRGREAELAEELKAKYEARLVDSTQTTYEGNSEVRRNRFGDIISRRELSPEEAADRKAAREALAADTDKKRADADRARVEAQYADDIALGNVTQSKAAAAASYASADRSRTVTEREGLDRTERKEAEIQTLVNEAVQMLEAVGGTDNVSGSSSADAQMAQIQAARDSGNVRELHNIINRIKGKYGLKLLEAKTAAETPPLFGGTQ